MATGGGVDFGVKSTSDFRSGRVGGWEGKFSCGCVVFVVVVLDSWGEGGTIPVGFGLTNGTPVLSRCRDRLTGWSRKFGSGRTEIRYKRARGGG